MTLRLVIRPAAEADIADAHRWYEAQQVGLGAQFLDEVALVLGRVVERPLLFPVAHSQSRRALMRRFPFSIYYRVIGVEARILAILRQSRDPRVAR